MDLNDPYEAFDGIHGYPWVSAIRSIRVMVLKTMVDSHGIVLGRPVGQET